MHERLAADKPSVAVWSTDLLATWEQPFDWWCDLETDVLQPLSAGRSGWLGTVTWTAGRPVPGAVVEVPPVDVLILEGVSSGRLAVAGRLSALLWVECLDRAARLARAVARDGEGSRENLRKWQDAEDAFYAVDDPRSRADMVFRV